MRSSAERAGGEEVPDAVTRRQKACGVRGGTRDEWGESRRRFLPSDSGNKWGSRHAGRRRDSQPLLSFSFVLLLLRRGMTSTPDVMMRDDDVLSSAFPPPAS